MAYTGLYLGSKFQWSRLQGAKVMRVSNVHTWKSYTYHLYAATVHVSCFLQAWVPSRSFFSFSYSCVAIWMSWRILSPTTTPSWKWFSSCFPWLHWRSFCCLSRTLMKGNCTTYCTYCTSTAVLEHVFICLKHLKISFQIRAKDAFRLELLLVPCVLLSLLVNYEFAVLEVSFVIHTHCIISTEVRTYRTYLHTYYVRSTVYACGNKVRLICAFSGDVDFQHLYGGCGNSASTLHV